MPFSNFSALSAHPPVFFFLINDQIYVDEKDRAIPTAAARVEGGIEPGQQVQHPTA